MVSENMPSASVCYYDVLKVSPRASDAEIKRAYRVLALAYHPDRNPGNRSGAELRFRLVNDAYAHLNTREKRARYNRKRRALAQRQAENDNRALAAAQQSSWLSRFTSLFQSEGRP